MNGINAARCVAVSGSGIYNDLQGNLTTQRLQNVSKEDKQPGEGHTKTPDANTPDANKPGANTRDVNKPDANRPDVNKSEANRPDVNKLDVNRPDANKLRVNTAKSGKPDGKISVADLPNPSTSKAVGTNQCKDETQESMGEKQESERTMEDSVEVKPYKTDNVTSLEAESQGHLRRTLNREELSVCGEHTGTTQADDAQDENTEEEAMHERTSVIMEVSSETNRSEQNLLEKKDKAQFRLLDEKKQMTLGTLLDEHEEAQNSPSSENAKADNLSAAKLSGTAAKDVIQDALEYLDQEAERLRKANSALMEENERVKAENEDLRKGLKRAKKEFQWVENERDELQEKVVRIQEENERLKKNTEEFEDHLKQMEEKNAAIQNDHLNKNGKLEKEIQNARKEAVDKEAELMKRVNELEKWKKRLKEINKRNNSDRYMEIMHELEMLKSDKINMTLEMEAVSQEKEILNEKVNNLQNTVKEKLSELSNEKRRHFVLTKEFNSLLVENNRLKQQKRSGATLKTIAMDSRRTTQGPQEACLSTQEPIRALHFDAEGKTTPLLMRRSMTSLVSPRRPPPGNPNFMARTQTPGLDLDTVTSTSRLLLSQTEGLHSEKRRGSLPALDLKTRRSWKP